MKRNQLVIHFWMALIFVGLASSCSPETDLKSETEVWITKGDKSMLFEKSTILSPEGEPDVTIKLDEKTKYQEMLGFGFALTQGSAQALMVLDASTRKTLLEELYKENQNVVRISIGASDLSNSVYSYNENVGDIDMQKFSFAGPDEQYLFPVLKEILEINPDLKIMATPWSPPTWMKTNGTWIGGELKKEFYPAYANYFLKYVQAMKEIGFEIWAITPQNEPLNDENEPSMIMRAVDQLEFVDKYLGPTFEQNNIQTKIIAYDHNCDEPGYPITVLNGTKYAEGAAFHLYGGDISAMSAVHEATNKDVFFTEQFVSSKGSFGGDLEWHFKNVLIGSTSNWSRTVIEWNLATQSDFGPRTPGGCTECLGAVTVNGAKDFEKNVSFYIIQHLSKFVKRGAYRISSTAASLPHVTFLNPDGSKVLLAFNSEDKDLSIEIVNGETSQKAVVPAKSAVTIVF